MARPIRELGTSKISLPAQRSLDRLKESHALNWFLLSDAKRNDESLPQGAATNKRYNVTLEYYLGTQQLIHAADTLNSYCQSILALILKTSDIAWEKTKSCFEKKDSAANREAVVSRLTAHRENDGKVREILRDHLSVFWPGEAEVIVVLRNKFVHQNGHDPKREVEKSIAENSAKWCVIAPVELIGTTIPIRYENENWLDATGQLGRWACLHVNNHISLLDQQLCQVYNLPRDRWRPRPVSRSFGQGYPSNPNSNLNKGDELDEDSEFSSVSIVETSTPVFHDAPISEKDISCSQTWRKWSEELIPTTEAYYNQLGLDLIAQGCRLVGLILPNTLAGQERSFEWTLRVADIDKAQKSETVYVRLREAELKPFITIWSTTSALRDFNLGQEKEAIEYIKDCIDKTLTKHG